jgi:hypothetical protein
LAADFVVISTVLLDAGAPAVNDEEDLLSAVRAIFHDEHGKGFCDAALPKRLTEWRGTVNEKAVQSASAA